MPALINKDFCQPFWILSPLCVHEIFILKEVKNKEWLKFCKEVVKKMLKKRELSMFGADKKLRKRKESEDRARFR